MPSWGQLGPREAISGRLVAILYKFETVLGRLEAFRRPERGLDAMGGPTRNSDFGFIFC